MTRQKLTDAPAIKTLPEAEATLQKINYIETEIAKHEVRREKTIETANKNYADLTASLVRERDLLACGLEDFSYEHFADGGAKSHSCEWGKFGLRQQTRLVIDNLTECIKAIKKKGLDECLKVTWAVNRHILGQKPENVIESVGARKESEDVFFWETQKS